MGNTSLPHALLEWGVYAPYDEPKYTPGRCANFFIKDLALKALQSLDDLVSEKAIVFADQMKATVAKASKEEEIRIEAERQLAFIQEAAGIELEGKHEFTVASGRVDSVYDRVIIEYKNPASAAARIGTKVDSPGSKKVIKQIQDRFGDMQSQFKQPLNTLFGVGLDGKHFIFVRFRNGKWDIEKPVEVNRHSVKRFLWALFNLGTKGKPFTPQYLADDFGSRAPLARGGIHALYNAITSTDNARARTFLDQWKILFGEVCGYDVDTPSTKLRKLAESYEIPTDDLKPAELLFSVHTYYAIFMKLLASEIVTFFHKLPSPLRKMVQAGSSNGLKREVEELEAGGIFRHLGITNFLEGDLFAWYVSVWDEAIDSLVRDMVARLDDYNPGTLSEEPDGNQDMLKKLYQQLLPKSVRHDLGEYYTPDWLADHVLNELGYIGDPDKRLLDPACGSGTFLVQAINRIRESYEEDRENYQFDEGELCRKVLSNVVGFDLNPLAVMAARTNYLIAIRDLISHVDRVEIPVYLCDPVTTPSEYGGIFAGELGQAQELKTAVGTFLIPTEIATNSEDVARYADQLEFCIRNKYSTEEFVERCRDEHLAIEEEALHSGLYSKLVELDEANKNGIWARIIKNAFAPLFVGRADYIAGNPPWVNWEHLPEDYRQSTAPLWARYGLFRPQGYKAKLGGGKDDISMLFTYVCHDCYLADEGRLGFVITRSVFKTKGGGEGFRRFRYDGDGREQYLNPLSVHDLTKIRPFEGAANTTAVIVVEKADSAIDYPIPYVVWEKLPNAKVTQDLHLDEVIERTLRREILAEPVDKGNSTSPWLTASAEAIDSLDKVRGTSSYKPRKGVYCATNAVYWLTSVTDLGKNSALVSNLADTGKKQVASVDQAVEKAFVHKLVRGKDVSRWHWNSALHIILPQHSDKPSRAVPETDLKKSFPKTHAYFKQFEEDIRKCALLAQFFDPAKDPFYSSYNVGEYTYQRFKVVWKEVSQEVQAAVIDSGEEVIVPDHKLVMVSCQEENSAYFLSAVLNSSPIRLLVRSYATQTSISGHIAEYAQIPQYSSADEVHSELAELAKRCHTLKAAGNDAELAAAELQVDDLVAGLWGIIPTGMESIREAISI